MDISALKRYGFVQDFCESGNIKKFVQQFRQWLADPTFSKLVGVSTDNEIMEIAYGLRPDVQSRRSFLGSVVKTILTGKVVEKLASSEVHAQSSMVSTKDELSYQFPRMGFGFSINVSRVDFEDARKISINGQPLSPRFKAKLASIKKSLDGDNFRSSAVKILVWGASIPSEIGGVVTDNWLLEIDVNDIQYKVIYYINEIARGNISNIGLVLDYFMKLSGQSDVTQVVSTLKEIVKNQTIEGIDIHKFYKEAYKALQNSFNAEGQIKKIRQGSVQGTFHTHPHSSARTGGVSPADMLIASRTNDKISVVIEGHYDKYGVFVIIPSSEIAEKSFYFGKYAIPKDQAAKIIKSQERLNKILSD